MIFVSHARTFVNALCNKVLEIRFGTLRNYPGPYEEYVSDLAEIMEEESKHNILSTGSRNNKTISPELARPSEPWRSGVEGPKRAEKRAKLKELQRAVERLEKVMKGLDRERSEILQFYF